MAGFIVISRVARAWPGRRQAVVVAASVLFLGALHGAYTLHVLLLTAGAYALARTTAGVPYGLLLVWAYACGTLLAARLTEGLPFARLSPSLAFVDAHRGLLRWHIHYNLLVLRLLSYASDLRWALQARRAGAAEGDGKASGGGAGGRALGRDRTAGGDVASGGGGRALELELRRRAEEPLPLAYYASLPNVLEYALYPLLYIAGPIATFNAFASQRFGQPIPLPRKQVVLYALRLLAAWACLEAVTHLLPYNAIATSRALLRLAALGRAGGHRAVPRPLHFAITGYWVIVFMWLKFTVIWRFFRLAALADGLVPPENMTRCVCNNYDVEGFWRSWHASYNRWLVRYMYVPLGGTAWRVANVWVIFTFVAAWHDLEWRLMGWAWIMAGAVAPEMAAKALARSSAVRPLHGTAAFRHACALAAALNILLLMSANLVGFVVGVDGIGPLLEQVLGQPRFLAVVLVALFAAAQLMFWVREREAAAAAVASGGGAAGVAGGATGGRGWAGGGAGGGAGRSREKSGGGGEA
ncbi:hypothetical protein HYH03_011033 [Edaphochlamys debaryana]|uniref:Uncharacterized protein n=1 Tax=Edaphochlamys debaryana TaxID=47281 RepID=A0A835XW06_9CHLO|nr:hypothetical protein HYH03_011033 [Edaphochlamys debaryana]|eukprot:KAG2490642.1 hypothetical protein HYH03_011033 [Edaphochlamys debaryana]